MHQKPYYHQQIPNEKLFVEYDIAIEQKKSYQV